MSAPSYLGDRRTQTETLTQGSPVPVREDPAPLPVVLEDALDLLQQAGDMITGDRQDDYGDPLKNFTRISTLWEAYLGTEVDAADVALMMSQVKQSRLAKNPDHVDSWIDLIAYCALGAAMASGRAA